MPTTPAGNRLSLPASSTSSGPLPMHLRSALNSALLTSGAIPAIHAALLHECQATGFVATLKARARELLRTGECTTYGEVVAAIMLELREGNAGLGKADREDGLANGVTNGDGEGIKLKVPQRVVEEGVRVVRSALEGSVEIGED